jgi:hypothetical protein
MSTIRTPGFTAEAALYSSSSSFPRGVILPLWRQHAEGLVQLAVEKRRFFCGLKVCCVDFRDLGLGAFCFDRETGEPA